MELVTLDIGLKYLASQGTTLNVHEITGLNAGMGKLQCQEKYNEMFLWGKIIAIKGAYYICYGLRDEILEFPAKKFYYSTDNFDFAEFPVPVDEEDLAKIQAERNKPFSGDPDLVYGEPPAETEEGQEEEKQAVTELMRLAETVREIDHDCSVVPKGSHTLNENQKVVRAPEFSGLQHGDALKLGNYVHLRAPETLEKLRVMARDDNEWKLTGFLDSLTQDLPVGAWAVRDEAKGVNVHLRSLIWIGYAAFHVPRTQFYGGLYLGHGVRNADLPFLL